MKKEKSFRVFVIYAILLQFAILLSFDAKYSKSILPIQNYTTRDSTVQILIAYADLEAGETTDVAMTGTGTIIYDTGNVGYVLTARHVCYQEQNTTLMLMGLIPVIEVYDVDGVYHSATVALLSTDDDLCILKFEPTDYGTRTVADIADRPPTPGESVSMYAAPAGFYVPSAIARFSGEYNGLAEIYGGVTSVFTMPAAGGSSGGGITNSKGEVVGVLHSTLREFHHISLGTSYDSTIGFIEQLEIEENVKILD